MPRRQAALLGAREVGFTVVSMSLSLIAVFIPILLMSGIVGRLFREFAVTLSIAILVSMVVSLTTTPMMCAYVLKAHDTSRQPGRFFRWSERGFAIRDGDHAIAARAQHPFQEAPLIGIVFDDQHHLAHRARSRRQCSRTSELPEAEPY